MKTITFVVALLATTLALSSLSSAYAHHKPGYHDAPAVTVPGK